MTHPVPSLLVAMLAAAPALQEPAPRGPESGRSFIEAPTRSEAEDRELLKLYEGLRVADVSDGLDAVGLQDVGLMDPEIKPLWRDTDDFSHCVRGIAVTVRYVPANRRMPSVTPESFHEAEGRWYRDLSPEPFVTLLHPGSVVVIDGTDDGDTGSIGSNNIMLWKARGAVGVVTSGGARDSDEIIKEKVPLYYRRPGRGIRPGRNLVESVNRPVTVGGALVRPGDVVVADGDGVVVVPREHAAAVARVAHEILESDKAARRALYERLGLPPDRTVEPARP
jgi:4-hydroxy-4-methyl-2-oxoglutarate aldolase